MFLIRTLLLTGAMMFTVLSREHFHKDKGPDSETTSYMWYALICILISQVI